VAEAVQKWFAEKLGRPDLAEVFNEKEARKWLMRKVKDNLK
jgi:hypothetical protein